MSDTEPLSITSTQPGNDPASVKVRQPIITEPLRRLRLATLQRQLPAHQVFRSKDYLPDLDKDETFWLNMINVRQEMQQTYPQALVSTESMKKWFAKLHTTAMLGANRKRYYRGVSYGIPNPGEYRKNVAFYSGVPDAVKAELRRWLPRLPGIIDPDGVEEVHNILLPGISSDGKAIYSGKYFGGTFIYYPRAESIDEYLRVIWQTVRDIEDGKLQNIKSGVGKVLTYWSTAHPFPGVNHSLIMNFNNFLLERHGLDTVPAQLSLWTLAICMKERFPKYFQAFHRQYGIPKTAAVRSLGLNPDIDIFAGILSVNP